ncbi:hypothetical protein LTR17_006105 [Elasticomyces elasticus]|nr:hypothetical protein LTR17_006105 [Elasticomyces elasticus]
MESIQGDATIEGYKDQCQALYKRVQSYGKLFSGRHESTETRPYALEGKIVVQHVCELFIPAKMSKEGADRDFTPDQWDEVLADLNNFATDGDAQESWYTEWKIGIPGCTALNLERKEFGITRPKWEDQERKQQKVKQESPKEKSKREKRESKNHKAVEKSDVARDDGGAGGDTPGVNTRRGEKVEVVTEQIFCYVRDTPIKSQFAERLKDAFNRLVARIPPEIDGTPATLTAAIQDFELETMHLYDEFGRGVWATIGAAVPQRQDGTGQSLPTFRYLERCALCRHVYKLMRMIYDEYNVRANVNTTMTTCAHGCGEAQCIAKCIIVLQEAVRALSEATSTL